MSNEVYIDGVNVAECMYLNKVVNEEPYCHLDEEHLYTCNSDEDCYFKQLQRLKEEIKQIAEGLKTRRDWTSIEEVNAEFDKILDIVKQNTSNEVDEKGC